MTRLPDEADRRRAAEETELSLLVEASAGTGKTRTLIDRIANLVLADPEEGGLLLTQVAALTFTEKAAGEMKERLRLRLEAETRGPRSRRAAQALATLDLAEIGTIHAFCARLLRERPVEAGVDPDFTTPDEPVNRQLFDEVFARWLDAEARVAGPLAGLLERGLSPDDLHTLALKIYFERTKLEAAEVPDDALEEAREALLEIAAGCRALAKQAPTWRGGPATLALAEDLEFHARLDLGRLEEAEFTHRILFNGAPRDDEAWRERGEALKKSWDKLEKSLPTLGLRVLLARLVRRVRASLLPAIAAAKRERRFLDFDDLLLAARDLLRRSAPARTHFTERFKALLVDEFQDTDPLQAEIVLRLAAADGDRPLADVELAGGALFVVGDPKQSIYRFRHADVETFGDVRALFAEDARLSLSTSFRSGPLLVGWVNRVFEEVLSPRAGEPWRVAYAPLAPGPEPDPEGPPVVYLRPGAERPDGGVAAAREEEARAVASYLAAHVAERVPWREVGILVPKNDGIDVMEEALRAAGIPSVAEGGRSYAKRQETGAILCALRAVADPGDGVALAAALKSFLFAASDVDLVEAAERSFRFDVAGEAPEGCAIAPHVALIQRLRARRHERPTAETLLDLLEERYAFASLEAGGVPNPRQGVANAARLLTAARACDVAGLSFREAVAALERTLDVESPEPRAFEESEDAVRVLTLHKSKGLEFGIVVLAGLGLDKRTRRQAVEVRCARPGGLAGARVSVGAQTVKTPRWEAVRADDEKRLRAEDRRLLYVGATRARRRLVVSWWGEDASGDTLLAPMAFARDTSLFAPGTVQEVAPAMLGLVPRGSSADEEAVDVAHEMRAAEGRLERARATASRPLRRAGEHAFVPVRAEDVGAADRPDEEVSDRALRVGVAVHAAMERLLDPGREAPSLAAVIDDVASELPRDVRGEVKRLVERLLADEVVARARASRRRFVEVPVLWREGEGAALVEGKIDLLFEEEDGLVVVDWKTDRVDSDAALAEREALYAPQLAAYEEGLEKALGPAARVKETRLVFARRP